MQEQRRTCQEVIADIVAQHHQERLMDFNILATLSVACPRGATSA